MTLTRRSALKSFALTFLAGAECLAAGRNPWRGTPEDEAAFLAAVRRGDVDAVRRMLRELPGLAGSRDPQGISALIHARLGGHAEVVEVLRDTGLVLDIAEAAMLEDWPRFEQLASEHPELLNALHPVGGTPLYAAALAGSQDLYRVRSAGCLPDHAPAGGSGWTPARAAMDGPSLPDARTAVTDLLGNGSDPNAPQRGGSSVLHGAVLRRDAALVRLAVRKGADVHARDEQGRTAALLAEEIGWDEGALLLQDHASLPRDHRASRYAFDHDRNPVRRPDLSDVPRKLQNETTGSSHGNLARVRELVESDPRLVFSHSTDDELAIEASAHVGNHDILLFHLEHGSPCSLPTAVSLGDADFCRFLLDEDPLLIHERGAHDFPLLWYVAIGGAGPDLAAMLHDEYGVPLDQESLGNTTLHWCVMREDHELAEWLLDAGADPSPVGYKWLRQGETPLALAQRNGARRLVDLLQRAGAS